VRVLAFLNVSFAGIYGFARRVMVGESGDLRLMAPIEAVEVANANRDTIVGVKVRVGLHASQYCGVIPLDIALGRGGLIGTAAGALVLTEINMLLIGFGLSPAMVEAALGMLIVALVSLYGREPHVRITI
jgi:hypothetical protein